MNRNIVKYINISNKLLSNRLYNYNCRQLSSQTASSTNVVSHGTGRPMLRVLDVLLMKENRKFIIPYSYTIIQAIDFIVINKLSSCLVANENGELDGIFTARDLLKFIQSFLSKNSIHKSYNEALDKPITDVMTKREKLVYCSPNDSVKHCREIMSQLKIRNLPVLDNNEAIGIINIKDLADSAFSLIDIGGKKGFIHNVTGRKGVPIGTKATLSSNNQSVQQNRRQTIRLKVDLGAFALPHPYKTNDTVSSSRRDYGAMDLCDDMSLCEDAHFVMRVQRLSGLPSQVYFGVADGVGSWRQYGVDPRKFSHSLINYAKQVIESDSQQRLLLGEDGGLGLSDSSLAPIHPLDVVMDAWNLSVGAKISGSSTICIATIDKQLNQLSYANIGDCGLMVVRHIDSDIAGYMRERQIPRHLRKGDLRIAYLSQQQLRSFNLPYQLGFSDIKEYEPSFETPSDSDTASIPILPGDVIVLATDGLYDNIDLDEIVGIISEWETKYYSSTESIYKPDSRGEEAVNSLAKQLVEQARKYSIDKNRDSPFAQLAKENDIMWGGGMPDDTTVIVVRVFNVDG